MNIYKSLFLLLIPAFLVTGCSADSEDLKNNATPDVEEPSSELAVENFIYKTMSDIYLYNEDVPVLAPGYFSSTAEKEEYLMGFSTPEKLYEELQVSHDEFSYLIEDYRDNNRSSAGTERTSGMSFQLVRYCQSCSEVFGYVRLVKPNSAADEAGVERGMIFNRVNGQQLTVSNYQSLISSGSYTIGLAQIEENTISELDRTINITERAHTTNPIIISKVLEIEGSKIGYLFYEGFEEEYDEDLNREFAKFKSEGISELVLDLRYNGGGSVRTATDLASMITGQFTGEIFMKEKWNKRYQEYFTRYKPEYIINRFNDTLTTNTTINSLNLNRVFVLATKSSASASELIINGLDPYINVIHIGDETRGKFQGSMTIHDSPDGTKEHPDLNTDHFYALQPLTFKSSNANNVSDYLNGLYPDILLKEDVRNLGTLGDPSEPLLKAAINEIKGTRMSVPAVNAFPAVGESGMFEKDYQKMFKKKFPGFIKEQ